MEDNSKRRSKRKTFRLKAEITLGSKSYRGFIENLSGEGLFGVIIRDEALEDLKTNMLVNVKFEFPTGETFNLFCEIKRLQEDMDALVGRVYNFGMEIIDQSPQYKKFISTL
ncbi:MAG: PilZ domain-containing protein [Thermodesulfovibrionia bacterium]|nr:PilZ domain-containing protein [Thermodesulfovibrionia bacterium]